MRTIAVTGGSSGIGAAIVERLRARGDRVLTIQRSPGDVRADLGTPSGRAHALAAVAELCGGTLDGVVVAAGVEPGRGSSRVRDVLQVDYVAAVAMLDGLRPLLAARRRAYAVAVTSNVSSTVPAIPAGAVRALLRGDAVRAERSLRRFGHIAPVVAYGAAKLALTRWVRRGAVTPEWAGAGIRLNALAPGAVLTPLLERQLADPAQAPDLERFPIPSGGFGRPDQIAPWAEILLGSGADFACGSVVVVDGGTDALLRADDWPRPIPLRRLVPFLRTMGRLPSWLTGDAPTRRARGARDPVAPYEP